MKKLSLVFLFAVVTSAAFAQDKSKEQKRQERNARINQLMKEEEEGALVYNKQNVFGGKLSTDGYGIFYEHGKYKTIKVTNLWWVELGERKDPKEEKVTNSFAGFQVGNPYVYGKINNLYYLKLGLAQQRLIGGKDVKNGVAVSAIYGGGISAGLLKPYYLSINTTDTSGDFKYSNDDRNLFTDPGAIIGGAGFSKGFNEVKFIPGVHARVAMRFDYGHFNELVSAIEAGVTATYYTKDIDIMLDQPAKKFFFNAYVALAFGKRK